MWVEKHGDTFRIREQAPGGAKVTLAGGYLTKTAAKDAMAELRVDVLRGEALVPGGGQLTLDAFLDEWWPGYEASLKPMAKRSEGGRVRNHLRALLGHLALEDITASTVQRWVADLGAGTGGALPGGRARRPLAPKTVANCHGLLFTVMRAAIHAKLRRDNPCAGTSLPIREHKEMRFLTDPEMARLVAHVPAHWKPLVKLLLATGLRWGEAIGLKVGRVDLLAKSPKLLVVEQMQDTGSEILFHSPKSARSRRTVSFTKDVAIDVAGLVAGKEDDELVFTAPMGGVVRTRNFRRGWLKWTAAAGLEGLRIHDLRHTHASILFAANMPLPAISRRLGHSTIAVTDALYGHIREEVHDGMLAAIEAAMAGVGSAAVGREVSEELIHV